MSVSALILAAACVAALGACQRPKAPNPGPSAAATSTPAGSSTGIAAPQQALDRLDGRVAVPLLPMMANHQKENMRDHLLAVQEIVLAAGNDDFAGVERAAGRIGYSEQMGRMCTHMGAAAPGFTEQALDFHHTADTIAAAARQRDRAAVLRALGATLRTCTGCHAAFKQRVVDEATWNGLTSTQAPHGHPPGP